MLNSDDLKIKIKWDHLRLCCIEESSGGGKMWEVKISHVYWKTKIKIRLVPEKLEAKWSEKKQNNSCLFLLRSKKKS
jgi:hypothetical protein